MNSRNSCLAFALPLQAHQALAVMLALFLVLGSSMPTLAASPPAPAAPVRPPSAAASAMTQATTAEGFAAQAAAAVAAATGSNQIRVLNGANVSGAQLSVAPRTTYVVDVGHALNGNVNFTGNLTNLGSLFLVSSNAAVTSATLTANNIYNLQGARISSALQGVGAAGSVLDLNLVATRDIVNYGTISSSGSLALSAGNIIVNGSVLSAQTAASISANQNVSLQAPTIVNTGAIQSILGTLTMSTANLVNSGNIEALQGNAIIRSATGNTLSITNTGGTIAASHNLLIETLGSIYDQNKLVSEAMIEVVGGRLSAPTVSINSPKGRINMVVEQLNGKLDVSAANVAAGTTQSNLTIGNANITADPVFFAGGTLDLSGLFSPAGAFNTYGGDFIALAGGDIVATTAPAGAIINTQSGSTTGGRIYISAGTTFTVTNPTCAACINGIDYTVGGPSAGGGSIQLSNVSLVTNQNSIDLIAYGAKGGGTISVGDVFLCCATPAPVPANNITIIGDGQVTVGNLTNSIGSITVTSNTADVTTLASTSVQSFNGSTTLSSLAGNVNLGQNSAVTSVGGNTGISALNNINAGSQASVSAFGIGNPTTGNVTLSGTTFQSAGNGKYEAVGGAVTVNMSSTVTTGANDTFTSHHLAGSLSGVTIAGAAGNVTLGTDNKIEAVGGNVSLVSGQSIAAGSGLTANAFKDALGSGGAVGFIAVNNVQLGSDSNLNAVGGNLTLSGGGKVSTSSNTSASAFKDGAGTGSVTLVSANNDVEIGASNTIQAVNGNVSLAATNGAVSVGNGTTVQATGAAGEGAITAAAQSHTFGSSVRVLSDRNTDILASTGNISSGTGSKYQSGNGNVVLIASKGSVLISDGNTISADGGDAVIAASSAIGFPGNVTLGANTTVNAFRKAGVGGAVQIFSAQGNTQVGASSNLNATGGNLTLSGKDLLVFAGNNFNAFDIGGVGGDVNALYTGSVNLTGTTSINATGGNVLVTSAALSSGAGNKINAFSNGDATAGNVSLTSSGIVNLTGTEVNALGGDIYVSGGATTLQTSQLNTFDPASATKGKITIISVGFTNIADSKILGVNDVFATASGISVSNSTIASGDKLGGGSIFLSATGSQTITDSSLFAYKSVSLVTNTGDINLSGGSGCTLCSVTGNVELLSGRAITLGSGNSLKALDGQVTLTALVKIDLGSNGLLSAGGGDVFITSFINSIDVGTNNNLQAFTKLSAPAIGGNIYLGAPLGSIDLGTNNHLDAVGGIITLNSPSVNVGTGNCLCTYTAGGIAIPGSVSGTTVLTFPVATTLSGTSLTVYGDLIISAPGLTLNGTSLTTLGGDITLNNTGTNSEDLFIDENNVLMAFSTAWIPGYVGPYKGGNIYLNSTNDIRFFHNGGVGTDPPPFVNTVQAAGGVIVLNAARSIDIFMHNSFVSSGILPGGGCGNCGGIYFYTGTSQPAILPVAGPQNIFTFNSSVNIDPAPGSFSSVGPTAAPILQVGLAGGDKTTISVSGGGTIDLDADALIHILASDLTAINNGIIHFKTDGNPNSIQFKDSQAIAGCVPITPPPTICIAPTRPDCVAPAGGIRPTIAIAPTAAINPGPGASPTAPTASAAPTAPACPPAPVMPPPIPPPGPPFPPPAPPVGPPVSTPPTDNNFFVQTPGTASAPGLQTASGVTTQIAESLALPAVPTVVTNQCVSFFVQQAPQSYLQATAGTEMQVASNGDVQMNKGSVVVRAGLTDLTVRPANAMVRMKSTSIAVIDSGENQSTVVTALASSGPEGIVVTVDNNTYSIEPGERIMISKNGQDAASAPAPLKLEGRVEKAHASSGASGGGGGGGHNVFVLQAAVSLPEYVPTLAFMGCRQCLLRNYLGGNAPATATGTASGSPTVSLPSSDTPNAYREVAYTTAGTSSVIPTAIKASTSANLTPVGRDHYKLTRGNVLVQAPTDMTIETQHATILLKAGAISMVSASQQLTRVRDISDHHVGDVTVLVGKNYNELRPGKELNIIDSAAEPISLVMSDNISRRAMQTTKVDKLTIISADFSMVSMLSSHPLLVRLRHSSAREDQSLVGVVYKTATAINMALDRTKSPYYSPKYGKGTGFAAKPVDPVY